MTRKTAAFKRAWQLTWQPAKIGQSIAQIPLRACVVELSYSEAEVRDLVAANQEDAELLKDQHPHLFSKP
jgi:hypothetical protein